MFHDSPPCLFFSVGSLSEGGSPFNLINLLQTQKLMYHPLMASRERKHRTLFTVVSEEGVIQRIVQATEEIVGDLSEPHTGILIILPVWEVFGLPKRKPSKAKAK